MSEEGPILNKLIKANLPIVPASFFEGFADEVLELIALESETEGILEMLSLNSFENVLKSNNTANIQEIKEVYKKETKSRFFIRNAKHIALWTGAVAASLVLLFSLPLLQGETNEFVSSSTSEDILLAYLNEDDLIEYIIENGSEIDSSAYENEVLYEELESGILDYYYDL